MKAAAIVLIGLGSKAVPALKDALNNKSGLTRYWAINALGEIGPQAKDAVPALIEQLKDDNEQRRTSAGFALEKIDPDAAKKAGVP